MPGERGGWGLWMPGQGGGVEAWSEWGVGA